MPLEPGRRLGPYEVVSPLGAGGMGEVYLARDTRLGREVALKILPSELAADPERRARFEREARAVAALSHPNVCALYDVGRAEGHEGPVEYLVMEKLEGETLAERLAKGPLPTPRLLEVGRQIAEALGAAHRQGIVHRDLKPANVMLTPSGAKLLDFGLARQADPDGGASDGEGASLMETASAPLTRAGMLLGTWPYLSPEQLTGGAADARSDIFALGAVLFEMATGRRAFPGTMPVEISSAILHDQPPDLRALHPGHSAALATLVRQCLARDPAARWHSADDVARGLRLVADSIGDDRSAAPADESFPRQGRLRRWLAAAALVLVGGLAAAALLPRRGPVAPEPLRFVVRPPAGALLPRGNISLVVAVAPDGRQVAFVASADGTPRLWLWSAAEGRTRPLEGTEGASGPFFSPDGGQVAYFASDELRRISVGGGPATRIVVAPFGNAGAWGADGTILYTSWIGPEAGLWAVPATGGEPRPVARAVSLAELHAFPSFLPDGRHYLYLSGAFGGLVGDRRACVASLDGGPSECFAPCDSQAVYSASGHVLCLSRGTLVAQPFDAGALRPSGAVEALERSVRWFGPTGAASFAVSADGRVLVHEPDPMPSRLAWLDRGGREVADLGEPARYSNVEISRDGRRVSTAIWNPETGGRDVWSLDARTGVATRLTFEAVDGVSPVWSPDGGRVAFGQPQDGPPDVVALDLASGQVEVLQRAPGVQFPRHWSPDGRTIACEDYESSRRDRRQIWLLSVPDGGWRRFRGERPDDVYEPRFAPDGRMLAYVSEESGRPEVYVSPLDGRASPRRLSRAGGLFPRWRGDGRELLYFQPDGMMVSVDPALEAPPPRILFHVEGLVATFADFDVTADGQRFLVRLPTEPEGAAGLNVALHWSGKAERSPSDARSE